MTYENPIIPGFHPDPSVCRVGDDHYLVTSSFTVFPGVPLFHSTDLVDWRQIGNVLDRPSQLDLSASAGWASMGIYAPTIRHHDGRFFVITTNVTNAGLRTILVTAEDPWGPWSDPVVVDVPGVDPDLSWDDDGTCWSHTSAGSIHRTPIDTVTGAALAEPEPTWSGTGLKAPEAPHLYRRQGTWYLMVAEGGTERGHAVSVARGPSAEGPWEGCPANPVLSHRSTAHPIQNVGHADLVEAVDGSWWMVCLGVRPKGISPGFHVLGRETFLAPVTWSDGWPRVHELDLEVGRRPPGTPRPHAQEPLDRFDGTALSPQWVSLRRPPLERATLERPGGITLHGTASTLDTEDPTFVARRQQHQRCRARSAVSADPLGIEAGLAVVMDELHHYEVCVAGDRIEARSRIGPVAAVIDAVSHPGGEVVLVVEMHPGHQGPDMVQLGFEDAEGTTQVLARLDGRYLSTEVTGGFLGRLIGMYAVGGSATFRWFEYGTVADEQG